MTVFNGPTNPLSAPWNLKASSWKRSLFSSEREMNFESEPVILPSSMHLHQTSKKTQQSLTQMSSFLEKYCLKVQNSIFILYPWLSIKAYLGLVLRSGERVATQLST